MKFPWQKSPDTADSGAAEPAETAQPAAEPAPEHHRKGYTPPKGKPTPTRREQEIARGVVRDPNALSTAEASQRRKDLKKSMSKEEWKEYKRKEREENRERNREIQKRMDSGDERYLMERDRGEARRFVRDWVDSRRHLSNWIMPGALLLLVIMLLGQWFPAVANIVSLFALIIMFTMLAEGVVIGRGANQATRERFPGTTETGFGLGMYAFSRASQPRKWRTPKPQVEIGAKV